MSAGITHDIQRAAVLLRQGEVVAIPTETVYGLAANALDPGAVVKIFSAKNRPHFDPLIVHIGDIADVEKYAVEFPEKAKKLAEQFWPGPLTIVLRKKNIVPDIVTSGLDTVGIRMPNHPLTLELLRQLDFPLAAPSANPFGYISPTSPQHVADQLGDVIPLILDGGHCNVGVESTIIDCTSDTPVILRHGGLSVEAIESVIGAVLQRLSSSNPVAPLAPGMLDTHYAPRKKMILGNLKELLQSTHGKIAVMSFRDEFPGMNNIRLSPSGNIEEAAQRLFAAMRELDASDTEIILAELVPDEGIGKAVNDRLRRAAS